MTDEPTGIVQAYIIGTHSLPSDIPEGLSGVAGDVYVVDGDGGMLLSAEAFDDEYEWIEEP